MTPVLIGLLSWIGASTLVCLAWALVASRARRRRPSDEELVAAFRARVQRSVMTEVLDHGAVRLATEDDARAWGFPPDWMAAERVQLFWNSRRAGR